MVDDLLKRTDNKAKTPKSYYSLIYLSFTPFTYRLQEPGWVEQVYNSRFSF